MKTEFGIGSENGHTTIHPHKTDQCDTCGKLDGDIQSLNMSIKRLQQQHDQFSAASDLSDCQADAEDLRKEKEAHLLEAAESQAEYRKQQAASSHSAYCELTTQFNALPRSAFTAEVSQSH